MTHHVQRPGTVVDRVVTPSTLAEALAAVAGEGTRPIAGGTDLLIELARGEHRGLGTLVDLTRVAGLDEITVDDERVTIGALVTHNRVVADPRLRDVATPLVQACREVGSPQLRNRATIVGNLVTASPANDTISALVALGAEVEIASTTGRRRLPLTEFHTGIRRTALEPGELVTAVSFAPLGGDWRGLFLKLGNRRAQAISVVHLAVVARLVDGVVAEARISFGSVAPTVDRATEVEAAVVGSSLDDASIDRAVAAASARFQPIDDVRATAGYRQALIGEMTGRALRALGDGVGVVDPDPVVLWGGGDGRWSTSFDGPADHGPDTPVTATVDGTSVSAPRGDGTLLDWLRSAGRTGTKEGCAEGECGSCTVRLDGQAVLSCLVPPSRAEGTTIVTVEGLADQAAPDGPLHPLQQAFVEAGAVQCGYCIPGFLVAGSVLLDERPRPTEAEVVAGLAGNLCRCTGYYKIIEAFHRAADGNDGDDVRRAAGGGEAGR